MERTELVLAAMAPANGEPLTPVQVQKLFFIIDERLAHRLGGKKFSFEPYHYGPFDAAVYRELEVLATRGLAIIDKSGSMKTFTLTPKGQVVGHTLLATLPADITAFLMKACEFVRTLSFADLVSSIYREFPEMKKNSIFVE